MKRRFRPKYEYVESRMEQAPASQETQAAPQQNALRVRTAARGNKSREPQQPSADAPAGLLQETLA